MSGFILFLETFFGQFFYGGFWKAVGSGILFGASWLFGSFDIALQAMLVALFLDFGIGL